MSKIKLEQIDDSIKGVPNGLLLLDSAGKVESARMPQAVSTHLADNAIHVTSGQKTNWDNNITNLTNHINNLVPHVSASDRTKWDGAQLAKLTESDGKAKETTTRPQAVGTFVHKGSDKTWYPAGDDAHVIVNHRLIYGPFSTIFIYQEFRYLAGDTYYTFYNDDNETWSPWTRMATQYDVSTLAAATTQLRNDLTQRTIHTISALTGGATISGTGYAYKEGTRVYIELICTLPNAMAAGTTIFTLPTGLRPSKLTYMPLQANNGQLVQFAIASSGAVSVNSTITSNTSISVYGSFALEPLR